MTEDEYNNAVAAHRALLHDAVERMNAASADARRQRDAIEALAERWLAAADDDVLVSGEAARAALCALPGMAAHRRRSRLLNDSLPPGLAAEGIDGRDEYAGKQLPALTLALRKDQPVDKVIAAMRRWARVWALGRRTLVVRVLESTLSQWQSYNLLWDVASGEATVQATYSGELFSGSLDQAVAFVAKTLPYKGANGESIEDPCY